LLGSAILIVRRHVPESPRWLFIHGHEEEAERIVSQIEDEVRAETGAELPEPDREIVVHQREAIPFREIAGVAARRYPTRALLGLALFIGQAFLYNAVTFDLGTILHNFFAIGSSSVPWFMLLFALSNFMGPLFLGRLFDTVGRIPMIAGTYLGSAAIVAVLALLLRGGHLHGWSFMALVLATFFLASAGASSAYLTVSEIFPMETRALAIALFYAVGTAIGGISGPLLFGQFIHSGNAREVATGFLIGAGAMALGGVAELLWGVPAEQRSLEAIATPLTAEEVDSGPAPIPEGERAGEDELRGRIADRRARDHAHRLRPGSGSGSRYFSPGMLGTAGTASRYDAASERSLDHEIELVTRVVVEDGGVDRAELSRRLRARGWGPGRFRRALRHAVREGRVREAAGGTLRAPRRPSPP
jgi:MFS family permease